MADKKLIELFLSDKEGWKKWRAENPEGVDFRGADFRGADLKESFLIGANCYEADFSGADLRKADLRGIYCFNTNFEGANLAHAQLSEGGFVGCNFKNSILSDAVIVESDISHADFCDANLSGASLRKTRMVQTNFTRANLTNCKVYGAAVWDVILEDTIQEELVITEYQQPEISVDSLEVAQFLYLLLSNEKLRSIIDTITAKVVLILGRFSAENKPFLDKLRENLRHKNYLPVLFDFTKPANRDLTETISTLAHLSRFIVADLSDPRSIPQELATVVPHLRSVPVQPLIKEGQESYGMFQDLQRYPHVLAVLKYRDYDSGRSEIVEKIIADCESKVKELLKYDG